MGYFDDIEEKAKKKNLTQEIEDMQRFAGNAFWYSIGSLGMLVTGIVLCFIFHWIVIYAAIPVAFSILFSFIGVFYAIRAQRSASRSREKYPLVGMAMAYNLLWIVVSVIVIILNTYESVRVIVENI